MITAVAPEIVEAAPLTRNSRQRGVVPPARLDECEVVVIGVGAIGRQVALQLAAVGASRMWLFDHDIVGIENLAPQGYWPGDIGAAKVEATGKMCVNINPECKVSYIADKFRRSTLATLREDERLQNDKKIVLFCCVDSIETRKMIWEAARVESKFFVDARMSAEVIRVLAIPDPILDTYYPTTLFASTEAYVGACTARSTIYTASIAAGLMIHQFARWLREMPTDSDQLLNLLASELSVEEIG